MCNFIGNRACWVVAGVLSFMLVVPVVRAADNDAAAPGAAQPAPAANRGRGAGPQQALSRFAQAVQKLDLSEQQRQQIKTVLDKARTDFSTMSQRWRTQNTPVEQRRQESRQLLQQVHQQISAVLTPAQQQTLRQQIRQSAGPLGQHRALRAGRRGPTTLPEVGVGRRGAGPAMIVQRLHAAILKLDLSAEQKQKIASVVNDARQQIQSLQQQARGDRQELAQKVRTVAQNARRQINEVLTPDQRQKLRSLVQEDRRPGESPRAQRGGGRGPAGAAAGAGDSPAGT